MTGIERLDLGKGMAVLLDVEGDYRFEHPCSRALRLADPGDPLLIAPKLGPGHAKTGPIDSLTVTPSILCSDCGTHGLVTNGVWRST